jgi:hypothetical protein
MNAKPPQAVVFLLIAPSSEVSERDESDVPISCSESCRSGGKRQFKLGL